jgi:hypothetical protein
MMLDLVGGLLKVFASEQAHLLSELAQLRMPVVHSRKVLLLVGAAIVPPGQVNELADCYGEILAELTQVSQRPDGPAPSGMTWACEPPGLGIGPGSSPARRRGSTGSDLASIGCATAEGSPGCQTVCLPGWSAWYAEACPADQDAAVGEDPAFGNGVAVVAGDVHAGPRYGAEHLARVAAAQL